MDGNPIQNKQLGLGGKGDYAIMILIQVGRRALTGLATARQHFHLFLYQFEVFLVLIYFRCK